jgi:hypothetical protein
MHIATDVSRPASTEPAWDQPGGLGIRDRRSWATWQVAVASLVALVAGMMVGYSGKKPSTVAGAGRAIVSLGAATGASAVAGGQPGPGAATETTITATATTATASLPGDAAGNAAGALLVPNTRGAGGAELPAFSAGGPWKIGWHFRCLGASDGPGPFTIDVVPDQGSSPGPSPAVTESGREAQGVTPQTATGHYHLKITADPACQWAAKVTGGS